MSRLRQLIRRASRYFGPILALIVFVILLGFSWHATLDWHRHGSGGLGFFHLHVHFGQHHHDGHVNDRHHHHHHPEAPESDQSEPGSPTGILALTLGFASAPAVALVAQDSRLSRRVVPTLAPILWILPPIDPSWSPRGPPT